jgi:hypothetical protein
MKFFIYILLSVLILGCATAPEDNHLACFDGQPIPKIYQHSSQNLNISLLLDLSDRINPEKFPGGAMEYYERDVAYIQSITQAFNMHLRSKRIMQMHDKMQLFFDPIPQNKEIVQISKNLKVQVDKTTLTPKTLCTVDSLYQNLPLTIYQSAIAENKYVGSNTWGFLKNKAKSYCIDPDYRNILVILTDGYIYHKDNLQSSDNLSSFLIPQYIRKKGLNTKDWKTKMEQKQLGFLPTGEDLSELEIMVIGIHPHKRNPYEEDVIKAYWEQWLKSMKVKRFTIKDADLPTNMDKIIKDFILLEK